MTQLLLLSSFLITNPKKLTPVPPEVLKDKFAKEVLVLANLKMPTALETTIQIQQIVHSDILVAMTEVAFWQTDSVMERLIALKERTSHRTARVSNFITFDLATSSL